MGRGPTSPCQRGDLVGIWTRESVSYQEMTASRPWSKGQAGSCSSCLPRSVIPGFPGEVARSRPA